MSELGLNLVMTASNIWYKKKAIVFIKQSPEDILSYLTFSKNQH